MKRGPSKGQRRESTVSASGAGTKKKLLMMPLLRKRAFSTTTTTNVPILPTFNLNFNAGPRQASVPFSNQTKLPSITFLTQPQQRPLSLNTTHFQTSPTSRHSNNNNLQMPRIFSNNQLSSPLLSPEELKSGYSSRSNSVPSYLPSENPKKLRQSSFSSTSSIESIKSPQLSPRSSIPSTAVGDKLNNKNITDKNNNNTITYNNKFNTTNHETINTNTGNASSVLDAYWQDRHINSYYQIIHPTLPILPSSKVRLRAFLSENNTLTTSESQRQQQQHLAAAVLAGINGLAVYHTDPAASAAYRRQLLSAVLDLGQACGGLVSEGLTPVAQSLYLICMVCLFLFTDEPMWLSSAISMAYSMKLHFFHSTTTDETIDEETRIGRRRLFLVLVILDTMNASAKNLPQLITAEYIRFDETTDSRCFTSPVGVQLIKLCLRLSANNKTSQTELDQIKADIEGLWDTNPVLKALYYSVLLSHTVGATSIRSEQLHNIVTELTSLMVSPLISVSPLMPFFFMFVVNGAEKLPLESPHTASAVEYLQGHIARIGSNSGAAMRARIDAMAQRLHAKLAVMPSTVYPQHQQILATGLRSDPPAAHRPSIQFKPIRTTGLEDLATAASAKKLYT